jgi:hypothetical protein
MSRSSTIAEVEAVPVLRPTPGVVRHGIFGPWIWAGLAMALLAASGLFRLTQDRRFAEDASYRETCPFDLKDIPYQLGPWKMVEGGEKKLDDLTVRITGSTNHIVRTYVDELTGVTLTVLVLFGPAEPVIPHTPDICYPACGFATVEAGNDVTVDTKAGPVSFRAATYAKSGGRAIQREEVYHSFRLDKRWSAAVGDGRKFPRRNPGIFKVQIQRRVAEGERRNRDNPIEQFLTYLIPSIEQSIAAHPPEGAAAKTEVAAKP